MITAVVTSLDSENLLATPSTDMDVKLLVGKKVNYVDKSGKVWSGVIKGYEDQLIVVKLDPFPTGLGQGQLLEIPEEGDEL
jgi:hypothetical protein